MKNKWIPSLIVSAVVTALALLLQTLNANRNRLLEGKDREAVLAYSTPIAENLKVILSLGNAHSVKGISILQQ